VILLANLVRSFQLAAAACAQHAVECFARNDRRADCGDCQRRNNHAAYGSLSGIRDVHATFRAVSLAHYNLDRADAHPTAPASPLLAEVAACPAAQPRNWLDSSTAHNKRLAH
jgi:hypothetical protein